MPERTDAFCLNVDCREFLSYRAEGASLDRRLNILPAMNKRMGRKLKGRRRKIPPFMAPLNRKANKECEMNGK
jgi:hypothetical protein